MEHSWIKFSSVEIKLTHQFSIIIPMALKYEMINL